MTEFEFDLQEAEWNWLEPHLKRGAVVLVSHEINILQVARDISKDEKPRIERYVNEGLLAKPTAEQIEAWNLTPSKIFKYTIVQPFVLIQELFMN